MASALFACFGLLNALQTPELGLKPWLRTQGNDWCNSVVENSSNGTTVGKNSFSMLNISLNVDSLICIRPVPVDCNDHWPFSRLQCNTILKHVEPLVNILQKQHWLLIYITKPQYYHRKVKKTQKSHRYYPNACATKPLLILGGDIEINPGPDQHKDKTTNGKGKQILFCSMNARSIRNKTSDIFELICDNKPDLITITETWLTTMDSAIKAEVCPDGYKILDHPRTGRRGGGTALLYSDSFRVRKADAGQKSSYEFSEWLVKSSSHTVRVVIIYRPPYSVDHQVPCSVFI